MTALLLLLSGNMLIDALEVSIVVVALPVIATDLAMSLGTAQWLMGGFALGFGGLLLLANRLVGLLGRRRVYLAALLVFAVASVVGGLAQDPAPLIASRLVKGFCVALTAPTGLAIIASTFAEGAPRNRALAVYSFFGASGFSVGLLLSGLLTPLSWRWTFLLPAPLALVILVLARQLIPTDPPSPGGVRRYDPLGAATFLIGVASTCYAIVAGAERGWRDPLACGMAALAVAAIVGCLLIERRVAVPLFRFPVRRHPALARAALVAAALNGSYWGFLLLVSFGWQRDPGWSPLAVALVLLPASLLPAVAAPYSARLVARFGPVRLIVAGLASATLGYAGYLGQYPPSGRLLEILPPTVLVGLAFVLGFAALHTQATGGVAAGEQAMAGAIYQSAVQIGGAVALALVTASLVGAGATAGAALGPAGRPALVLVTGICAAGLLIALTGGRTRQRRNR